MVNTKEKELILKNEDIINYDEQGRMHGRQIIMHKMDYSRITFDVGYKHGIADGLWIDSWTKFKTKRSYFINDIMEGEGVEFEH
jgi:hypothetical protein